MQPNPFLLFLKILAFATLAFLVGVSSCQQTRLEDKVEGLSSRISGLEEAVREAGRAGGGLGSAKTVAAEEDYGPERRRTLDAAADPAKPLGSPGRYRDFLSVDPDPEVPPEAKGHEDGELGYWYGPEPKGLNVLIDRDAALADYLEQYVCDFPAQRHWANPSKWRPSLCWRVEVSPDYKEWTLFFRKGVTWHAPAVDDVSKYPHLRGRHEVTANDYKFSLDIIRNPQTDCASLRGYYTDVTDVQALDDYTAVVRWGDTLFHSIEYTIGATLLPEFLYGADEGGRAFDPSVIGTSFNQHWYNRVGCCGCGPYRFASFESGKRILCERYDDWYGFRTGPRYPIRVRRLLIFPDTVTNLLKLRNGELDVSGLSAPQWKAEILDNTDTSSPFVDGRILHDIQKSAGYLYFGWKNSHPLFKDRNVRKALALACNRQDICEKVFLGRYRVMSSPVFPESAEADPTLKPLPFDLKAAARLFDEAGWKMQPNGVRRKDVDGSPRDFQFTLLWPGPAPDFEAALNQYQRDLLSIGVKMEAKSMEWAAYQKKLQDREFEACSLLWMTGGWEHDFDQIWHSRGIQDPGSSNHIEFSNPEVDRLSDELRREMDVDKRIQMVRRIGRVLYEEQPYCFFGWRNVFLVHWKHLKNVQGHLYKVRPFMRTFPMWIER